MPPWDASRKLAASSSSNIELFLSRLFKKLLLVCTPSRFKEICHLLQYDRGLDVCVGLVFWRWPIVNL
jgi:hypothetical protein